MWNVTSTLDETETRKGFTKGWTSTVGWYEITWDGQDRVPSWVRSLRVRTPQQRIKELMFGCWLVSVCMSNKCCFDKNTSGQESLCCPYCEPLNPSDSLLFLLLLFHYLPLKSFIPSPFSLPHSLPSLQFTLTSIST